jgi:membrane fusion protein (multidrug efflux system)
MSPDALQPPANDAPPPEAARGPFRWRRWAGLPLRIFVILLAAFLVASFAVEWNWWVGSSRLQSTDDAYLQADLAPLGSRVSGYVRAVPVTDYQKVEAGDLLVEIVDDDYRAQAAQAEANLQATQAALINLDVQKQVQQAVIDQATANVTAAQSDLTRDSLEAKRQQELLASHIAGTNQLVERAMAAMERSQAAVDLSKAQLAQQRGQLTVLDTQEAQTRAQLQAQRAALELARISLRDTRIVAPNRGVVGRRQVNPGQYVTSGMTVITLVPLPDVFVLANYKETQLTHMGVGQTAVVTVDSYPGVKLTGHVLAFAPATGSQFSLLPPDNATGNFTKVVQRVSVKITIDQPNPLSDLLRPGMSVIATVDTGSPITVSPAP